MKRDLTYIIGKMKEICPMPVELELRIRQTAKQRHVSRNTVLLDPGETCDHLYYIEQGILCCHEIADKEKYCTWLMREGDIATSVDSFNNRQKSKERIEAVEDCILHTITYEDLEAICMDFPDFRVIRQKLTEKYYNQAMLLDAQRKREPEDFYRFLAEHDHFSEFVLRVPITVLASFMGIHRSTYYAKKLGQIPTKK
jgi:CRP/FNR family transcriptional regulator, anaerobic regulatory protein